MIRVHRERAPTPEFDASSTQERWTEQLGDYFQMPSNRRQERPPVSYSGLRDAYFEPLQQLFCSKCAFTERRVARNGAIARYRPPYDAINGDGSVSRPHYWWRAFRWDNLYLAHPRTVLAKGNHFPVNGRRAEPGSTSEVALLLDPCEDEPSQYLRFAENGYVYPVSSGTDDRVYERAIATIQLLELNDEHLVRARIRSLEKMFAWWSPVQAESTEFRDLAEHLDNKREFAGVLRQCIMRRILNNPEWRARLLQVYKDRALESTWFEPVFAALWAFDVRPEQNDPTRFVGEFSPFGEAPGVSAEREAESGPKARPSGEVTVDIEDVDDQAKPKKTYRLSRVSIENFRGIDALDMRIGPNDQDREDNEAAFFGAKSQHSAAWEAETDYGEDWHVLLGENGSGKSCVLQAIAAALCFGTESDLHEDMAWWRSLRRRGARKPTVIELWFHGLHDPYRLEIHKDQVTCTGALPPIEFLRAYGSIRLSREGASGEHADVALNRRARNIFDPWATLVDPFEYLLSLDPDDEFPIAAQVIRTLFALDDEGAGDVGLLEKKGQTITLGGAPLDAASDGYRSVITLACDLLSAISASRATGVDMRISDHRQSRGIVLIDELGVYLHPRWRMRIVKALRKIFPGAQVIASTHEPLCLRGLRKGEIVRIWRDGKRKRVRIEDDLPSPHALRVDQLLTSPIFGLFSSVDPQLEAEHAAYYQLLREGPESEDERERMRWLRDRIYTTNTLGDSRRDQLIYLAIDRLLAERGETTSDEALVEKAMEEIRAIWDFEDSLDDYL